MCPNQTIQNLTNVEQNFDGVHPKWGFRDSVNVDFSRVSDYYLSLDQGMIMASTGNAFANNVVRKGFVTKSFQQKVKPVMNVEEVNATPNAR